MCLSGALGSHAGEACALSTDREGQPLPLSRMPKKEKAPKAAKGGKKEEEDAAAAEPTSWTCPECEQLHEGDDAAEMECIACGAAKPAQADTSASEDDRYRGIVCGVVNSLEDLEKSLKACTIDVGKGEPVTIVTNASNVVEGSRVVVATVGASVPGSGGDEDVTVAKRSVGGRTSEGMLCDAPMLGWVGGGAGAAALVPESFAPGARPPEKRPRMDGK